jgi:hypothetical protein
MTATGADAARASGVRAQMPRRPAHSRGGGGRRWRRCSKRQAERMLVPALDVVFMQCSLAEDPPAAEPAGSC